MHALRIALAMALSLTVQLHAQELTAENPLAVLNDQLKQVLAEADVPFSDSQERAIALMLEERRRASEELFGDLMDFRGGPTQGQQQERLRSAIDWLRSEFIRHVTDYLTPEQIIVWSQFQTGMPQAGNGLRPPPGQTQYVRINSNRFTAEDPNFGGGGGQGTEVIQRGGVGGWHGNAQFLLKDDALNARNAFAGNKPPYQERRLNLDVSGPVLRDRLTSSIAANQSESKNVDTVRATLPDGVFALGITRPNVFRQVNSRSTLQLADAHSLGFYVQYATESSKDQGIGGFTLPERASNAERSNWNTRIQQFSAPSSRSIFESRLQINGNDRKTIPVSEALRINVLDAFNGGGAQNRSEESARNYQFGNLYTRLGEKLTLKTGLDGRYQVDQSFSTNNFGGTFTFSSLETYVAGTPLTYRVNRGTPLLDTRQLELATFVQADLQLNRQLTLMVGARYDVQTNLDDYNNLAPRVGFAYSPGQATVIRGGGGVFYNRLDLGMVQTQRRLDGTRQFEIAIDNPSYPDPFAAGNVRQTFPSVRVTDPDLVAPYLAIGMMSLERTFLSNLLFTATYEFQREYHRLRVRDLNAPFDTTWPVPRACQPGQPADTCVRPDPTRGNVMNLESTGKEIRHNVRLNVRKRFSIFNASANYQLQRAYGDVQGSPGTAATDSYDVGADWGRAPFPQHTVSSTLNARLPLGIFLTGAMSANSGRFYTITTGRDDNRDTNVTDRPPGVPPNSLRGPAYLNFDFNVSKAFFFRRGGPAATSGMNLNVFANMTNAFNRVHYGTPSGVMTSPNFGRPTSARDPREIEVGFRFQF